MRARSGLRLAGLLAVMLGPVSFVACGNVTSTGNDGGGTGGVSATGGKVGASGGAGGAAAAGHSGAGGGGAGSDGAAGHAGSGGAGGSRGGSGGTDASQCVPACTTGQLCCEEPLHGATDGPRTQWICVTTSSTTSCPAFP